MLRYDGPGTQHRFKHLMRPRQRGVLPQDVVGVKREQIVGPAMGELDVPGAVVPEVDPGFLVEFARNTVQHLADQVLRPVRGAGVGDHPVVDERANGLQTALDHERLVLDDHAQAESLLLHGHTRPGR